MKYFFLLGNNPTLSTAEISAVFPINKSMELIDNVLMLEVAEKIDVNILIKKMGGTIKIGELVDDSSNFKTEIILENIKKILNPKEGKYKFGISYYGKEKFNIKPLGMEIKKYLKSRGVSCRWVVSKEKTLSSVVVEQNKLTTRGIEIILIKRNNKLLIGKTSAVQPFKELSFRDYGRPARDDRSGMLPPKLAQIMINLSGLKTKATLLDPFCGSGTILTEAMLMGYKNIIGSDISKKAIQDSEANILWIKDKFKIENFIFKLYNKNATKISQSIKSVDAIITEPFLGPQRGRVDIKKITKELEGLYSNALIEFRKILKPNGKIVIIFPVFQESNFINPNLHEFKIVNPISTILQKHTIIKLTNRNTIVYGRPGQKVWREIVVLEVI